MTTDPKALIAEARELLTSDGLGEHFPYAFSLITRLAAALEEATVPEGWRVKGYKRSGLFKVDDEIWQMPDGNWRAGWATKRHLKFKDFPTAREAVAALDGAAIDTSA